MNTTTHRSDHVIGYAYARSERANALGFNKTGCYTVNGNEFGCATFQGAVEYVKAHHRDTTPGRWSLDHSLNLPYLSADQRALVGGV